MQNENNTREQRFMEWLHSDRFIVLLLCALAVCFAIGWGVLVWNENRIRHLSASDVNEGPVTGTLKEYETLL